MIDPQITQAIAEINQHIAVLNDDYTKISVDVAILKSQMGEIMWWFKAVLGATIVMLVSQFWQVLIMRKNGQKKE